jgi:xanthine dehydrogenase YagS FAD-binding subunit
MPAPLKPAFRRRRSRWELQRVRCPYFRATDAACNKRMLGSGCDGRLQRGSRDLWNERALRRYAPVRPRGRARRAGRDRTNDRATRRAIISARGPLPSAADKPHLEHTLEPAELIVAIEVPCGEAVQRWRDLKVRDRAAYEFAVVSTAVALEIADGVIRTDRIAAGGVGTKPWRLRAAEPAITDERPGQSVWTRAGVSAVAGASPLSGNAYKVELLRRTVVRAMHMAADAA